MNNVERRGCGPQRVWTLYKDGRATSCVLTDLEQRGCELALSRSDTETRLVFRYRSREKATAEAERLSSSYLARGWTIQRDRRRR
jgi:hypothetical protein